MKLSKVFNHKFVLASCNLIFMVNDCMDGFARVLDYCSNASLPFATFWHCMNAFYCVVPTWCKTIACFHRTSDK